MYTTRVSLSVLERVLILISNYCRENACFYTDNRNIREFCLCKDGLHLLESGKKILASIFTVNLNKFFRETHTHTASTNIYLNDSNLRRTTYSLTTELQILHHERLIHSKNPRIGYLNTNRFKNYPKVLILRLPCLKGLICNRITKYEPKYSECICSEITFFKKKWIIFMRLLSLLSLSVSVDP